MAETEVEARAVFDGGIDEHCRQLRRWGDPTWAAEAKAHADFKTVSLGACYRDRDQHHQAYGVAMSFAYRFYALAGQVRPV
jgi:hypothetical protein